jgi:hypothetical protein
VFYTICIDMNKLWFTWNTIYLVLYNILIAILLYIYYLSTSSTYSKGNNYYKFQEFSFCIYIFWTFFQHNFCISFKLFPQRAAICLIIHYQHHIEHTLLFCGNYNLPNISWSNDSHGLTYTLYFSLRISCVPELFVFNGLYRKNSILNFKGSIIDLIYSNTDSIVVRKFLEPFVSPDSYTTLLVYYIYTLSNLDINTAINTFWFTHNSILRFVPVSHFYKSSFPLRYPKSLKHLFIEKIKLMQNLNLLSVWPC